MKTATYTIPAHLAPAIVNDDWSGTSEADEAAWADFVKDEMSVNGYEMFWALCNFEDAGFMVYHDLRGYGVLACDCVNVIVQVG